MVDVCIDGDELNSPYPQVRRKLEAAGMLQPDAIAGAYWMLHRQPPTAWALELDLRPSCEAF